MPVVTSWNSGSNASAVLAAFSVTNQTIGAVLPVTRTKTTTVHRRVFTHHLGLN